MNDIERKTDNARSCTERWLGMAEIRAGICLSLVAWCLGCGSSNKTTSTNQTQSGPQTYLAPFMVGPTAGSDGLSVPMATYTFDGIAETFSLTTYSPEGGQIVASGVSTELSRGLLGLGLTTTYAENSSTGLIEPTTYHPALTGDWAVELPIRLEGSYNSSKAAYSFPAVAIAGQLDGKYAIFLIGVDSSQPWGIYLLQSN